MATKASLQPRSLGTAPNRHHRAQGRGLLVPDALVEIEAIAIVP